MDIFNVNNGVEQGAVLSPLLFAVYVDDFRKELRNAGLGCHINGMFTGAFIYADDITLIASSYESISYMLHICEQYPTKHDILFNPVKSQCMFFCKCSKLCTPYSVYFKHNCIHFVDSCKLLVISRDITDIVHSFN